MLLDSCDNIHDATDVRSDYITVCEDMIIPKKTVKVYLNNKPWVSSKSLKKKLSSKRRLLFRLETSVNGNVFKINSETKSEKQRNSTKKNSNFSFKLAICVTHRRVLKR